MRYTIKVTRYTLHVTQSTGQILIELIIAIGIGIIIITSIFGLFVDISESNFASLEQTQGEGFAQEAIEALQSIREANWDSLISQSYPAHPVNNSGVWQLDDGSELLLSNFTRQITMSSVFRNEAGNITTTGTEDPSIKKFTVTVSWERPRNTTITKEIYLSRYQGNTSYLETTLADFLSYTGLSYTQVTNDSGGEIKLAAGEGEGEQTGNRFTLTEISNTSNLDNANKKISFRFTAQHTGEVDYIRIYINDAHSANPPKYRYGLQSDLDGKPSGVWLGEHNQAYKDYRFRDTGWQQLELEQDAEIVQGTTYHLVIEYQSDQINSGKYINLRALTPLNKIVPYNSEADESRMILWSEDNGVTWTDVNKTPVFVLIPEEDGVVDYDNSEGNPYDTISETAIYGSDYVGQIFTFSDEDVQFDHFSTYVRKRTESTPDDDLYFQLVNVSTGQELIHVDDRILVTAASVTRNYQEHTKTLSYPVTLIQGIQYRLYFYSPGGHVNKEYFVSTATNPNEVLYNSINYFGTQSKYSQSINAGSSWTDFDQKDIIFNFSAIADTGYFDNGDYISSTFDAGNSVCFNRISWDEIINPGITNIRLQVAINDDLTWSYLGPDGTAGTFFTDPDGEAIHYSQCQGQYFRYKVYLTTEDPAQTPVLEEVRVNYSP